MLYDITPCPKPRMTRGDRWRKPARPCVGRYWAFKDEVRYKVKNVKLEGACVVFHIEMPASWPEEKKQQMVGKPHRTKPDLSNLIKALEDAMYGDDSHIDQYNRLAKVWARKSAIQIDHGCGCTGEQI
jgi:Holliday junction resolvase RusA-like endonuclease